MRCMMSNVMLKHPNFILMDEPTNHLDLESIQALNKGMQDYEGNILFTSHDQQLMNSIATRVIELTPNGVIDRYLPFDEYIRSEDIKALRSKMMEGAMM